MHLRRSIGSSLFDSNIAKALGLVRESLYPFYFPRVRWLLLYLSVSTSSSLVNAI